MKKLNSIDISGSLMRARAHLASSTSMDPTTANLFSLLVMIVEVLVSKFGDMELKIDPNRLPANTKFKELPPEKRQVFDIQLVVHVPEYR